MQLLKLIGSVGLIALGVALLLYASGCGGGSSNGPAASTDAIFESAPPSGDPAPGTSDEGADAGSDELRDRDHGGSSDDESSDA